MPTISLREWSKTLKPLSNQFGNHRCLRQKGIRKAWPKKYFWTPILQK
jgi:hypothetical protein